MTIRHQLRFTSTWPSDDHMTEFSEFAFSKASLALDTNPYVQAGASSQASLHRLPRFLSDQLPDIQG